MMAAGHRALARRAASLRAVSTTAASPQKDDIGLPVEIHAYADRTIIRQDGRAVAEHARHHGRGETIYYPWHYVPALAPLMGRFSQMLQEQPLFADVFGPD